MEKAIISVSNKNKLLDFAKIVALQFEILSTAGTFQFLKEGGISAQKIEDYTGVVELLGGKVKTLHPKIFAGILCAEKTETTLPIRLLVANLYPFEHAEIDIGGSALLRAAAKNYEHVLVVCDPDDYEEVARRWNTGEIDLAFRKAMAAKAFRLTAAYDAKIANFMKADLFPGLITLTFAKASELAYGENPSSQAALYLDEKGRKDIAANAIQIQGKRLSYNNILDADCALELVKRFDRPTCAIIKHNNPCGVAIQASACQAFVEALNADSLCAFGGVVAFNCPVDFETAEAMRKRFFDLVIAPDYTEQALEVLRGKEGVKVLQTGAFTSRFERTIFKEITGGLLVQTSEPFSLLMSDCRVVTDKKPTDGQVRDLLSAAIINQEVKSNSTVLVKDGVAIGIGSGQMSRIDSVFLAIGKAKERARGAVLSSDGFFPFADSIELAAASGVVAVIQPGGSKRDQEVIDACNAQGMAMIFTGKRLFKH